MEKENFSGCIVGEALGDAIGFLVEGATEPDAKEFVFTIKGGNFSRYPKFGQYSDDTQLARELLESIVVSAGFSGHDFSSRIIELFSSGSIVGYGRATHDAYLNLEKGVNWKESGVDFPAAGNGSAMRSAPIGLIYDIGSDELVTNSILQSKITHKDPRCIAGSIVIAGSVSILKILGSLNKLEFLNKLAQLSEPFDKILSKSLENEMPLWLDMENRVAAKLISEVGVEEDYQRGGAEISPFVTSSVLWSVYSFLKYPDNYMDAIFCAIGAGGDTDTTAAMTGALSGAYLGLDAIPLNLCEKLNDRNRLGYLYLKELSERAFRMYSTGCFCSDSPY